MHGLYVFCLVCILSLFTCIPAFGVETPSNADLDDLDTAVEDLSDTEFRDLIFDWLNSLVGGPNAATPSNASDPEVMETVDPDLPVLGQVNVFNSPALLSAAGEEDFVNVLRFDVSVDGVAYTLLFSPSYQNQLYIDSQNRLWNMGTSQVQGLVVDGSFNPYSQTGTLVYLAPCLGNNFSANRNYGSPNWFREYYWNYSGGSYRLTYDDTYVQIAVTKSYFPFFSGETLNYILIFLVGGGVLLCWLNRFKRY